MHELILLAKKILVGVIVAIVPLAILIAALSVIRHLL
jgi:hypothetical protein